MSKEFFWGDSLTGTNKEIKWDPSLEDDDDFDNLDSDGIQHFLFLKQAVLGPAAKEGERNVVEITTDNFDGDSVKQPLFSLKMGLNESSPLDIGVQPPVKFTLTAGTGPVFISGQHMIEISADDEEGLDEEEEEEEEDEVEVNASPVLPVAKSKKRPLSTTESIVKKTKIAKLDKDVDNKEDEEEEEEVEAMVMMEDDEDDEDDEDFEGEEEEEDEEDSNEDEEDDDEDEEEEEEEEDEETPEKPLKAKTKGKKGQMNGTTAAKGDNKAKAKAKTGAKVQGTGKGKKKVVALDEVKAKLQESSNVPKKEEKFKNYIRSAFHISEAKKLQDLWGWARVTLQK